MLYRRTFGLTPKQFSEEVDLHTFLNDLIMMDIEAETSQKSLPGEENIQNY